jgi:predicted transcriptional regulator
MSKKVSAEEVKRLREEGYSAKRVAEILGISRTRVYQMSYAKRHKNFEQITPEMNIYPNWRKWMNENSITTRMFVELMGLDLSSRSYNCVYGWMRGRCYPSKMNIDRILKTTGMTYEQLFYQEETA